MGYVYYPNQDQVKKIEFNVLHMRVTDYIYFSAGTTNFESKIWFKNFNGQIGRISLRFGKGTFHNDDNRFKAWVNELYPVP